MNSSKCENCIKQDVCLYKEPYKSFNKIIEDYVEKFETDKFEIETKCKSYHERYSFITTSPIITTTPYVTPLSNEPWCSDKDIKITCNATGGTTINGNL